MTDYSKSDPLNTTRFTYFTNVVMISIRLICFATTMISLYIGFSLNNLAINYFPLLGIAFVWTIGSLLHKEWISTFVFILTFVWIAIGFAFNFSLHMLLLATFSSLMTWDLDYLCLRFNMAMRIIEPGDLIIKHFQTLFLAFGIGIILTVIPFMVSVKTSLWLVLLLSLGIILGFREVFRYPKEFLNKR